MQKTFPFMHAERAAKPTVRSPFFLVAFTFFSIVALAQTQLIKDVNQTENQLYVEYANLVAASNRLFFTSQGKELWNSDGTASGTTRFKTFSTISDLTWIGSTLYFVGGTDVGRELWKSNGAGAATTRIKDIRPGQAGSDPAHLTDVNGLLFFVADDGQHGAELWKSDGTATGTVLVKDIFPGTTGSGPSQLTNVNGILYFSAEDPEHGPELWKSDGTAAGTTIVKDINPGLEGSSPESLVQMGGRLYFTAFHGPTGRELWKSNGVSSGTVLIKNFIGGSASPRITELVTMGNAIYFIVNDALWKSTGTNLGTTLVKELSPETTVVYEVVYYLTPLNGILYFMANSDLWLSDGTPVGTRTVTSMGQGEDPHFTAYNGSIYFFNYSFNDEEYMPYYYLDKMNPDGTNLSSIWNTQFFYPYDQSTTDFIPELVHANNALFFFGMPNKNQGHKLMKSDGTPEGTMVVKDTYVPTRSAYPDNLVNSNGIVYFKSQGDIAVDQFVYRTDGTNAGTFPIKRVYAYDLAVVNDDVFFTGHADHGYWQLWKTNGTATGTILMKQVKFSEWSNPENSLTGIDGALLFYNAAGELWKSNGTAGSTVLIKSFTEIRQIVSIGNEAFVLVRNGSGDDEIWKSNGTSAGTVKIETLQPATGFQTSYYFFPNSTLNGILYFFGTDINKGHEVWRSDGTASGTYRIKEIRLNSSVAFLSRVRSMTTFNNNIYFSAIGEDLKSTLYKSNGTAAGTVKIAALEVVQYVPVGEKLLLFASRIADDVSQSLWTLDGTAASPKFVKTISGESFYRGVDYEVISNVVYFSTHYGNNLWRTDGTECGTFLLPTGVNEITSLESIGNDLIFGANGEYRYGNEPYRYNIANAPPSPCATEVAFTGDASGEKIMSASETEIITSVPNPFNNDFSLRINATDQAQAHLNIYTLNGRLVESFNNLPCNTTHQLGQRWPPGMYLLSIRIGDIITSRKVIKQ
jgi:ELWxxDGT repeat protein